MPSFIKKKQTLGQGLDKQIGRALNFAIKYE